MKEIPSSLEDMIFEAMDKCKFIFFPEQRYDFFLDCSKNEIFALLFIYRRDQVTMSDVAQYMNIPLNTVTGVAGRLEKKGLVQRQRSESDKRVVTISMTESGKNFMSEELSGLGLYFEKVMSGLSEDEKVNLFQIIDKVFTICNKEEGKESKKPAKKIKRIFIQ